MATSSNADSCWFLFTQWARETGLLLFSIEKRRRISPGVCSKHPPQSSLARILSHAYSWPMHWPRGWDLPWITQAPWVEITSPDHIVTTPWETGRTEVRRQKLLYPGHATSFAGSIAKWKYMVHCSKMFKNFKMVITHQTQGQALWVWAPHDCSAPSPTVLALTISCCLWLCIFYCSDFLSEPRPAIPVCHCILCAANCLPSNRGSRNNNV